MEQNREVLIEHSLEWSTSELQIDREARRVTGVALTSEHSRNGYRYLPEALAAAVTCYNQKPIFLDHGRVPVKPQDRSARDLVGTVTNARFEQGTIKADIEVFATEAGETFLALVSANAPGVGMSHVVLAEKSADGATVTAIHDVVSVDVVAFPATTTTFREQQVTTGTLEAAQSQLQAARTIIATYEAQEQQRRINEWIAQSDLPEFALTSGLGELLRQAQTEGAARQYLQDQLNVLAIAQRQRPQSWSRLSGTAHDEAVSTRAFVAALKGSKAA